ncbi:MAG TPA: hypothetical protein VI037_05745 [Nitrososphaera sp.]
MRKKIILFLKSELQLLIGNCYIIIVNSNDGGGRGHTVAANSNTMAASGHTPDQQKNKDGENHAHMSAPGNFHASWSGREQCSKDPCREAYGIASNSRWQASSNG